MSDTTMADRLDSLTSAVLLMARRHGTRLSRAEMCERLGVCGKTLTERVRAGKAPTPGADGKWLLSEVVEWEAQR
jgi:hypothetical protein